MKTIFLLLALAATSAIAQVQPVVKNGSCPAGYYSSGNYCVPASGTTRIAIPKVGACPMGYYSSGKYCVTMR